MKPPNLRRPPVTSAFLSAHQVRLSLGRPVTMTQLQPSSAATKPGSPDNNGQHSTPARRPQSVPASVPLEEIETAIRSIRYGVVQIIIQDGLVIQIDKTEKVRLR
jgi:hypothetical protein